MKDSGIEWIGEIPDEWKIGKIKNVLISYCSGGTPDSSKEEYYDDDGTPWVMIADMTESEYIFDTAKHITEKAILDKRLSIISAGAVLYAMYASVGKVSELAVDATINQAILSLQFDLLEVEKRFMKLFLQSWEPYIIAETNGTTQFNLNANKVVNLPIIYPSLKKQKDIVQLLDKKCARIDGLIAHEESMIEELNAYKQSIITEVVTKGLDKSVPMKESGVELIGEIPTTWQICKLSSVCHTITDFVASGSFAELRENVKYLDEPDYAMLIRTTDLSGSSRSEKKVYINEHAYHFLSNSNLFGGEIVLPNVGACGDVYIVPELYKKMSLAPNSIMLRTKYNDKYYFYFFKSKCGRELLLDLCASTAQQKFNKTELRLLSVPLFPIEEQNEIVAYLDKKCANIDSFISIKQQKIEELKEYKKSLIYEYVTGKKEVV